MQNEENKYNGPTLGKYNTKCFEKLSMLLLKDFGYLSRIETNKITGILDVESQENRQSRLARWTDVEN